MNRADLVQREGKYNAPSGESEILGLEVAGEIVGFGSQESEHSFKNKGWLIGDRVMTLVGGGGYAQYAVAYIDHLLRIPEEMCFQQAACVSETYITAFLNLFLLGKVRDGDVVMLHGGGGGVTTAGIQLLRQLTPNATIVVTASTRKLARVQAQGAHLVLDYSSEEGGPQAWPNAIKTFTNGQSCDVILDHIGADYLTGNLKTLGMNGRLIIIGLMGGHMAKINLGTLMVKRQSLIGSTLRSRPVADKARIVSAFTEQVLPWFTSDSSRSKLWPEIDSVFNLCEAQKAHIHMQQSQHFGKIVLEVTH